MSPISPETHASAPSPDRRPRGLFWGMLLVGGVLWLTLRYLWGGLLPFLLAWLFSCLLRPLVEGICRRTSIPPRACGAGLVVLFPGVLVGLLLRGVGRGVEELTRLLNGLTADRGGLTATWEELYARLVSLSAHIPLPRSLEEASFYPRFCEAVDTLVAEGMTHLTRELTTRLPTMAMTVAGLIPSALLFFLVTLLACYYMTVEGRGMGRRLLDVLSRLLPPSLSDRLPFWGRRLRRLGRGYLRACLLLGLLTFLVVFTGLGLMRLPYALLLAFLVALVDVLPLLGTGIILCPWGAACLLLGQTRRGIGLFLLWGVCTLLRRLLEPRLMGEGLGLSPLLSLLTMYLGLKLFGLRGMLLAPLLAAGVSCVLSEEATGGGEEREAGDSREEKG